MLTDRQWKKFEPLLARLRQGKRGGRTWAESPRVREGILWFTRSGARWQGLSSEYPSRFNMLTKIQSANICGHYPELTVARDQEIIL